MARRKSEGASQEGAYWGGHEIWVDRYCALLYECFVSDKKGTREMKVHGACHCGKITYEAEVDPASVTLCHCTDCQTMSGAPFRAIVVAPVEGFVMKTGQVKTYIKTAESGNRRVQAFCGDCATPIYSSPPENITAYFLRLGALRERAQLVPQKQIWHRSSVPWALDVTGFEIRDKH